MTDKKRKEEEVDTPEGGEAEPLENEPAENEPPPVDPGVIPEGKQGGGQG